MVVVTAVRHHRHLACFQNLLSLAGHGSQLPHVIAVVDDFTGHDQFMLVVHRALNIVPGYRGLSYFRQDTSVFIRHRQLLFPGFFQFGQLLAILSVAVFSTCATFPQDEDLPVPLVTTDRPPLPVP